MPIQVNLQSINFFSQNITLLDGLTPDMIKIKYLWLLNAEVSNAIIGENKDGLVWYSGDWLDGYWQDGTWYSGTWHGGIWNNGKFYAYNFNAFNLLTGQFQILNTDNTRSSFLDGQWLNGDFYSGYFGSNTGICWSGYTYDPTTNDFTPYIDAPRWVNGTFHNGIMYDSVWKDGIFLAGEIHNSKWISGKFYSGIFDGDEWLDGTWYGGDFISGTWDDGTFTQLNKSILSRFGYSVNSTGTTSIWSGGTFVTGEFHSGVNDDNHDITHWLNGTFENGRWYGGHFKEGLWENGVWYNGIFGDVISTTFPYIYSASTWQNNTPIPNTILWTTGFTNSKYYFYATTGNTTENTIEILLNYTNISFPFSLPIYNINVSIDRDTIETNSDQIGDSKIRLILPTGFAPRLVTISTFDLWGKEIININDNNTIWRDSIKNWTTNFFNTGTTLGVQTTISAVTSAVTAIINSASITIQYPYTLNPPTWQNGTWYNGLWLDGTFENGYFYNGTWFHGTFVGGIIGTQ
jgi:hypothetical protein